jgi:hypothetical protein
VAVLDIVAIVRVRVVDAAVGVWRGANNGIDVDT